MGEGYFKVVLFICNILQFIMWRDIYIMKFYTNAIQWGNFLLIREVNNGERRSYRVKYSPTLYAQVEKPTNFKTLSGEETY